MASRLTDQLREVTRRQSARRPVETGPSGSGDHRGERPFARWALVVLALLVVGGWLLMRTLQADSNLQDCVMSGRKNCAPLEVPSGR